jgi:predicted Zn-dependent peptidase
LVDLAEQYFHKFPKKPIAPINNLEKPVFHSTLMHMKDNDMPNSNSGVFYNSPGWKDKDFYSFLLL